MVQLFPRDVEMCWLRTLFESVENAPPEVERDEALCLLQKCIELNEKLYELVVGWLKLHRNDAHPAQER